MTDTSNAPEEIWAWPDGASGWYSAGASSEVNLGLMGEQAAQQYHYTRTDAITPQQAAKVLGLGRGKAKRVRQVLGLMNAMINAGESHSEDSEAFFKEARGIILATERAIAEQESGE